MQTTVANMIITVDLLAMQLSSCAMKNIMVPIFAMTELIINAVVELQRGGRHDKRDGDAGHHD